MKINYKSILTEGFCIIKRIYFRGDLKLIFTLSSIFFICYSIYKNSLSIAQFSIGRIAFLHLIASFLITCISLIFNALAWKYLLELFKFNGAKINTVKLYLKSNILKYLPGGIWHFVDRIRVLRQSNSSIDSFVLVALEPFLMLIAALLWIPFGQINIFIRITSLFPLLIIIPKSREIIFNRFLVYMQGKLIKSNIINTNLDSPEEMKKNYNKFPFKPLLLEMIFILSRFIGFFLCLKAFNISNHLYFFDWISTFAFAWICGLIVPGAPGGIGVFEATFLLLTGGIVIEGPFILSLLCYRIVSTLADITMYSLSRLIKNKRIIYSK